MSILTRALGVRHTLRPPHVQVLAQSQKRHLSLTLRLQDALLPLSNSFSFSLATPSTHIRPEHPSPTGSAFLEELNEEYGTFEEEGTHAVVNDKPVQASDTHAAEVLLRLIAKGDLDGALAAKEEFDKLDVTIRHDAAFADAAIDALSIADPHVRSRSFIGWWSLAPLKECPAKLAQVCGMLMVEPYDIPLLMDFCMICARAGFVNSIRTSRLYPHIFRFGKPNATSSFLLKLEHEAKKHCEVDDPKSWMSLRNLAIRIHYLAGRKRIAADMYDRASKHMDIELKTTKLMELNKSYTDVEPPMSIPTASMRRYGGEVKPPSTSELASELRVLRHAIMAGDHTPHFESFLADFMSAYEQLGRKERALRLLRRKVFTDGSLAARARWVGGEMLFYSSRKRPLAILRTFTHYCQADPILAAEAARVLEAWLPLKVHVKRCLDWHFASSAIAIKWKIWPSRLCVNLAWKAVLRLSKTKDIERLYAMFVAHLEATRREPTHLADNLRKTRDSADDLRAADTHYYDSASHDVSTAPAVVPDASFFHHFVVACATRVSARRGGEVLADMQRLGLTPERDSWGAVAGAYARSGETNRLLRVLDHIDAADEELHSQVQRARVGSGSVGLDMTRAVVRAHRTSLATYNSVVRGLTECGMYGEARVVQQRMNARGLFKDGAGKRVSAILHKLGRFEKGKLDKFDKNVRQRRSIRVDDRHIRVDRKKTDWLFEEKRV